MIQSLVGTYPMSGSWLGNPSERYADQQSPGQVAE